MTRRQPRAAVPAATVLAVASLVLAPLPAAAQARAPADAAPGPERFAAVADIALHATEGLQRVALPLAVLQASRSPGLADVRIFDTQGRPVPMAWLRDTPPAGERTRIAAVPRFAWPASPGAASAAAGTARVEVNAAGAVVRIQGLTPPAPAAGATARGGTAAPAAWLLDLSRLADPAEHLARLQLDWQRHAAGVVTDVHIEGSEDARTWRSLVRSSLLELPDGTAPAVKHVDWPAATRPPRYLRLGTTVPLALTRTEVELRTRHAAEPARHAQRFEFLIDESAALPRPWLLDLHGAVPVSHLQVHLPQTNTVLPLRLEQRDDAGQPWRRVATLTAWRLTRDGREVHAPATAIAAPPARHWRLVPDARHAGVDATALPVTLQWARPQLVFTARGIATSGPPAHDAFRLAVGLPGLRDAAALDVAALLPAGRAAHDLPQASLGALVPQAVVERGLGQRLREADPVDTRRWALWAVLVLAVAVLALLARQLLRDVDRGAAQR